MQMYLVLELEARYGREPGPRATACGGPGCSLARIPGCQRRHAEPSSCSQRAIVPPMTPPRIGATQNSHSWLSGNEPPPLKSANVALPRLRAGLTEAFETGMAMMWMAVSARPMAMGAKPAGARLEVAPMMTIRKKAVSTVSMRNTE